MRFARSELFGTFFAVGVAFLIGCGGGSSGPSTAPVQGKVVFTKGGTPKSLFDRQGMIEFESVDQAGVRAAGEIQEDGSFTLTTLQEGASLGGGAVAGNHRVRINLDESATHLVAPQFLSFERSGITVKVPSDQPVEIKVWR